MEPKDARRQLFEWQAQFAEQQERNAELARQVAELREAHGPVEPTAQYVDLMVQRLGYLESSLGTLHQRQLETGLAILDLVERINELGREAQ